MHVGKIYDQNGNKKSNKEISNICTPCKKNDPSKQYTVKISKIRNAAQIFLINSVKKVTHFRCRPIERRKDHMELSLKMKLDRVEVCSLGPDRVRVETFNPFTAFLIAIIKAL